MLKLQLTRGAKSLRRAVANEISACGPCEFQSSRFESQYRPHCTKTLNFIILMYESCILHGIFVSDSKFMHSARDEGRSHIYNPLYSSFPFIAPQIIFVNRFRAGLSRMHCTSEVPTSIVFAGIGSALPFVNNKTKKTGEKTNSALAVQSAYKYYK